MKFRATVLLTVIAASMSAAEAPTVKLTLDEAVRRALEHNTTLWVERENLDQAVSGIQSAKGAYDVLWGASFGWTKHTDPVNSAG